MLHLIIVEKPSKVLAPSQTALSTQISNERSLLSDSLFSVVAEGGGLSPRIWRGFLEIFKKPCNEEAYGDAAGMTEVTSTRGWNWAGVNHSRWNVDGSLQGFPTKIIMAIVVISRLFPSALAFLAKQDARMSILRFTVGLKVNDRDVVNLINVKHLHEWRQSVITIDESLA